MTVPRVRVTSSSYASFVEDRQRIVSCIEELWPMGNGAKSADVHIHVGTPNSIGVEAAPHAGVRLISYSFAETTRIPTSWAAALDLCDEVWVPSQFTKNSFVASGVRRPIRVIPLGVDCQTGRTFEPVADAEKPFTFLWQGTNLVSYVNGRPVDGDRKRGRLVESAFRRANIPNSRLILKYLPTAGFEYESRIDPVWYICRFVSKAEITELDRQVDAFIRPTMGEGFGKPPLEKLALGIPAFATDWSGPTEYLGDFGLRRLAPANIIDVTFNGIQSQMAEVTEDQVVELLEYCVQNRKDLAGERERLRSVAGEKWDFRRTMKPRIQAALTDLCQ